MFQQALRASKSTAAEDLGKVSYVSRRTFDDRETFQFCTQPPCLEYLSLLIETALLLRTNRTGRVYVGFEKLSRMQDVADRYLRIADLSERVYVFGEPDWQPPRHPNMKLIAFEGQYRLAPEWFVITESKTLSVALVAFDEDGFSKPVLEERNFRAFKSSNPDVVSKLVAAAEKMIDSSLAK
ncbi:MAG: DICT sensory domain-containing protein [Pyrinomonadaceae bacterium]